MDNRYSILTAGRGIGAPNVCKDFNIRTTAGFRKACAVAFAYWNNRVFSNRLPMPTFKVSRSSKLMGYYQYLGHTKDSTDPAEINIIGMNTSYINGVDSQSFHNVLVHEMCHYAVQWLDNQICLSPKQYEKLVHYLAVEYGVTTKAELKDVLKRHHVTSADATDKGHGAAWQKWVKRCRGVSVQRYATPEDSGSKTVVNYIKKSASAVSAFSTKFIDTLDANYSESMLVPVNCVVYDDGLRIALKLRGDDATEYAVGFKDATTIAQCFVKTNAILCFFNTEAGYRVTVAYRQSGKTGADSIVCCGLLRAPIDAMIKEIIERFYITSVKTPTDKANANRVLAYMRKNPKAITRFMSSSTNELTN